MGEDGQIISNIVRAINISKGIRRLKGKHLIMRIFWEWPIVAQQMFGVFVTSSPQKIWVRIVEFSHI